MVSEQGYLQYQSRLFTLANLVLVFRTPLTNSDDHLGESL